MRENSAACWQQDLVDGFLADVVCGLRQRPRTIPPKHFYDAEGSRLFDLICSTPEYYPTRTETGILECHGAEMVALAGAACVVIELGSGSAIKTPLLLRHLSPESVYVPIDICEPHLLQSTRRIAQRFPSIRARPFCADYMRLHRFEPRDCEGLRRIVFFPGSSIGNCSPDEAVQLLRQIASLAGADGALLVGVDGKKSPDILEAAYNDAEGHTAAFNLNLLERMRRELGAQVEPDGFCHRARYNAARSRIEMHLVSLREQNIQLDGEVYHFGKGEAIHTENSYKYTVQEFQQLARRAGWHPAAVWSDPQGWFNVHGLTGLGAAVNQS